MKEAVNFVRSFKESHPYVYRRGIYRRHAQRYAGYTTLTLISPKRRPK